MRLNSMYIIKGLLIFSLYVSVVSASAQEDQTSDIDANLYEPVDRRIHPEYDCIGLVKTNMGYLTGFMISSCLMATSAHSLVTEYDIANPIGQKVKFYVGVPDPGSNKKFKYETTGYVIECGEDERGYALVKYDWAIIKLDPISGPDGNINLGDKVGFIELAYVEETDRMNRLSVCSGLTFMGYPGGLSYRQLWTPKSSCEYELGNPTRLQFLKCPSAPGFSGAPFFCRDAKDGTLSAIGFLKAGDKSFLKGDDKLGLGRTWITSIEADHVHIYGTIDYADCQNKVSSERAYYEIDAWQEGVSKTLNNYQVFRRKGSNSIRGDVNAVYMPADEDRPNGRVLIYISRKKFDEARGYKFGIEIVDSKGNQLFREIERRFISNYSPPLPQYPYWRNLMVFPLDKKPVGNIVVSITDNGEFEKSLYEFELFIK